MAGWSLSLLENGAYGRSHRSALGLKKLKDAIALSKCVLGVACDVAFEAPSCVSLCRAVCATACG
jgi:hypothetical protein